MATTHQPSIAEIKWRLGTTTTVSLTRHGCVSPSAAGCTASEATLCPSAPQTQLHDTARTMQQNVTIASRSTPITQSIFRSRQTHRTPPQKVDLLSAVAAKLLLCYDTITTTTNVYTHHNPSMNDQSDQIDRSDYHTVVSADYNDNINSQSGYFDLGEKVIWGSGGRRSRLRADY